MITSQAATQDFLCADAQKHLVLTFNLLLCVVNLQSEHMDDTRVKKTSEMMIYLLLVYNHFYTWATFSCLLQTNVYVT